MKTMKSETSMTEVVTDFFSHTMKITTKIPIQIAFRFGKANPRSIKVQLQNIDDKDIVFKHASNVKDVKNSKDEDIFVNSLI